MSYNKEDMGIWVERGSARDGAGGEKGPGKEELYFCCQTDGLVLV